MCNIVLVGQDWVGENIAASNEGWCISVQSLFFLLSGDLKNANPKSAIAQHT